jgi:dTDP-4-dehydrorhamnose reductase
MRILVTGANGRLGWYVLRELDSAGHEVAGWNGRTADADRSSRYPHVDLSDGPGVETAIAALDPELIIHTAAIATAEAVRLQPASGWAVNVEATRRLVDWADRHGGRLLYTSSDLVFDGSSSWYREEDAPSPVMEYGRTKRAAELLVTAGARNLTVRVSLLYGRAPQGREGFFDRAISSLRAGMPLRFFADEYRTPLDYATAAHALLRLATSGFTGLIHLGGFERLSRFELMREAAVALRIDPALVLPSSRLDSPMAEPRPADTSLDTTRLKSRFPDLAIPDVKTALGTIAL